MVDRDPMSEELRAAVEKVRHMVEKYSRGSGFPLNPDEEIVATVVEGLARNRLRYGLAYCPCVIVSGNRAADRAIICPCSNHKADLARTGICHCALYTRPDAENGDGVNGDGLNG